MTETRSAEFCAMCGPEFCSMHITREIERSLGLREPEQNGKREAVGAELTVEWRDAARLVSLTVAGLERACAR